MYDIDIDIDIGVGRERERKQKKEEERSEGEGEGLGGRKGSHIPVCTYVDAYIDACMPMKVYTHSYRNVEVGTEGGSLCILLPAGLGGIGFWILFFIDAG